MIKSLTVTNHLGDSIKLELTKPEETGFIVTSIDGLGPVKANINITEVTTNDGGMYNSARTSSRNPVINLLFMMTEKESIEDIRQKSYKFFPVKKKVELVIETDNRTLKTEGYVESNEPNIFSQKEGTNISIVCPDPYLYSLDLSNHFFSGIEPLFEFPFENNSLTEPLLEMSSIRTDMNHLIVYDGEIDIGVIITIHAIDTVNNLTVHNLDKREHMSLDTEIIQKLTGSGIIAGDTIIINTKKNHKGITLLRNGNKINILNCLKKGSKWLKLAKGNNNFAYESDNGCKNIQVFVSNENVYSGV